MKTDEKLFGKDMISTQDWSIEDLEFLLKIAGEMKKRRFGNEWSNCLAKKTFMMLFYNPSLRTRESFECAATELGGHAQYLEPKAMRMKTAQGEGEEICDSAKVMSRYAQGIGIRLLEDAISYYGEGEKTLREYAQHSSIPVISMAHDKDHPCQALADLLALKEAFGKVEKKKIVIMWGCGHWVRSWSSIQADLLLLSKFGMDITLAYPEGYDLDPKVISQTRKNARKSNSSFEISNSLEDLTGADVIYSRNWMSRNRYNREKQEEVKLALEHREWICDQKLMEKNHNAYYIHPMPIEREWEVSNQVADSKRSLIYDIAENRLHVQKAVMALTMGEGV
jgi:N-acetylornithine carbamoyltransferase